MEILKITEYEDRKNASMEINLEEEEIRVLLEMAINNILREAIDNQEKKLAEG